VKLLRDVARLKVAAHAASSNYVMAAIESNVSWSWGRGACEQRKLAAAQEQLKAALSKWHQEYVCTVDVGGIRKKYAAERVMVEVTHFLEAKLVIDKVASISTSMHRAHAEAQQS
jgi:capsid protein